MPKGKGLIGGHPPSYYLEKFGPDYFKNICRKAGTSCTGRKKQQNGYKGGMHTLENKGIEHFERIAHISAARRKAAPAAPAVMTCPHCLTPYPVADPRAAASRLCCGETIWYMPH